MQPDDCKKAYLLRIEAVNLENFILDSDDLSTVRGAGLLLLGLHEFLIGAVVGDADWQDGSAKPLLTPTSQEAESNKDTEFEVHLQESPQSLQLTQVSVGASVVIYSVQASVSQIGQLRDEADCWLRRHPKLRHATFSVEYSLLEDRNFSTASEDALLRVRRRQLRAPSVSLGAVNTLAGGGAGFCDIDAKRTASVNLKDQRPDDERTSYAKAGDKNFASQATHERRSFGRDRKIRLYHLLERQSPDSDSDKEAFVPAWEFEDIGTRACNRLSPKDPAVITDKDSWSHLDGKMAVFYADGNQFGRQVRAAATTPDAYAELDREMRRKRATLMTSFVSQMQQDVRHYWRVCNSSSGKKRSSIERFRIETLMWGGDELIWVVPAWCGLELVRTFFKLTSSWQLADNQLTHAAGIVFCSYKSPIRSVVSLAKDLANSGKQAIFSRTDPLWYNQPSANVVAYQVLESFDQLGENFLAARRQHRFPGMSDGDMVSSGEHVNELVQQINKLKNQLGLPRTRLHQIVQFYQRPDQDPKLPAKDEQFQKLVKRVAETLRVKDRTRQQIEDELRTLPSGQQVRVADWYHISELWDYLGSQDEGIVPQNPTGGEQ